MNISMTPTPPPEAAPLDPRADHLGLIAGLKAIKDGQFRCASCRKLSERDAWLVWVPGAVRHGDSPAAVEEACRQNAFNGHTSGWCLPCAKALSYPQP